MNPPARTRFSVRSQPARARILAAARQLFGQQGFEAASIRAIAAAAKIHPSMVMRYYGSKEGLFAAALTIDLQLPDLSALPRNQIGRTLAAHFLVVWGAPAGPLPQLLRMAITHPAARDRLIEVFEEQIVPALDRVAPPGGAKLAASLVVSQVLGLALTRYILRLPHLADLPEDLLVERVGDSLQGFITG